MTEHVVSVEGDHWSGWAWACDCGATESGFEGDGDAWRAGQEHERDQDEDIGASVERYDSTGDHLHAALLRAVLGTADMNKVDDAPIPPLEVARLLTGAIPDVINAMIVAGWGAPSLREPSPPRCGDERLRPGGYPTRNWDWVKCDEDQGHDGEHENNGTGLHWADDAPQCL